MVRYAQRTRFSERARADALRALNGTTHGLDDATEDDDEVLEHMLRRAQQDMIASLMAGPKPRAQNKLGQFVESAKEFQFRTESFYRTKRGFLRYANRFLGSKEGETL